MTSVRCPDCQRTIGSPTGLVAHRKSMHPAEYERDRVAAGGHIAQPDLPPPSLNGGIRWEDPPGRGRKSSLRPEVEPIVIELKRHPGKWARIREYKPKSGASTAAKHLREMFPDVEFIGRAVDTGSAVFARYVQAE